MIYGNLPYGINHVEYGNVRINRILKSSPCAWSFLTSYDLNWARWYRVIPFTYSALILEPKKRNWQLRYQSTSPSPIVEETGKKKQEFSNRDSHMVTHCSTNRSIRCLFTAERTGCEIFIVLWPNTFIDDNFQPISYTVAT